MEELGNRGEGWKLHLEVDEANQDTVENLIQGMGIGRDTETPEGPIYKRGLAGGQSGKDFTVYIGHKDDAQLVAEQLDEQAGDMIKATPGSDAAGTDIKMAGNVMGRFDVGRGGPQITHTGALGFETTDPKYNQYGVPGSPLLNRDLAASLWDENYDAAAARERAQTELVKDFGEAYTGSASPTQFPEPAATGGGGGGGGGEASAPSGASSTDFNVRMIFDLVDEAIGEKAEELKTMAQIESPFLSGDLRESHEVVRHAPASYTVQATMSYAKDVHEGHGVTNKKGGEVFGKVDGNPWMTRAINNLAE